MHRFTCLPLLILVAAQGLAAAQGDQHPAYTNRDANLDDLLEQAARHERSGAYESAVATYLEVEEALRKLQSKAPGARPTTEVGPGIDRGVGLYLRDRIGGLPQEVLERYRLSIDPRARVALDAALRTGDPEAIERVIERYPLSSVVAEALPTLGSLAMERGELSRALRAYRMIEEGAADVAVARQAALRRCYAAVIRGERAEAERALASYVKHGGDPNRARAFGARRVTPARLVAGVKAYASRLPRAAGFDPGALSESPALVNPELPQELARGLASPPTFQHGVFAADTRTLYVADDKTVRAIPVHARRGLRGWHYPPQPVLDAEPSRLEVSLLQPALGGGYVYATLHYNRPARLEVKKAGKGGDEEKLVAHRRKDWRVVALDRRTGRLAWDAANRPSFESIARNAEWVSAPLIFESAVYVAVIDRENANLRSSLVRLNSASGDVMFQTFIASRSAYDHLGLGSPPAPPTASRLGHIVVATGIGVVAAIEPSQGDVAWISRYPVTPQGSEPSIVLAERRFRPTTPLSLEGVIVVAPVDGAEVVALDPASGRMLWTAPRGLARLCVAGPEGEVLLLGRRLVVLDSASGITKVYGPDLGEEILAAPAVYGEELVAGTATRLVRVGLDDGKLRSSLRFTSPAEELGPAIALGEDLMATIGVARLNIYTSFSKLEADLAGRYRGTPQYALLLGQAQARREEVYEAVRLLQKAVRSGLNQTSRLAAQRAAIELLSREAERKLRAGDVKGFVARSERVSYFLGALGLRPDKTPTLRAQLELLALAAPTLRAYADLLADDDDPKAWAKSAGAYQRMLWTPPGTLVALSGGTEVEARSYARVRVRQLIAARGPKVYAAFEGFAREELLQAKASGSKTRLSKVVEQYPASRAAPDARWELAANYLRSGLKADSARELEHFLGDYPDDPRVPEGMARLVELYEGLGRVSAAREHLVVLCKLEPEPTIRLAANAPAQLAHAWAAPHHQKLFGGISPASIRGGEATIGLVAPLTRVYRGMTELSQNGAELIRVKGKGARSDLIFLRRGETLEVRRALDGERLLLIRDLPLQTARLQPVVVGDVVLIPFVDRIDAYSISREALAWRFNVAAPSGGVRIGPDPVHALAVGNGTALVLTGSNELLAIDARLGTQSWRKPLPFKATGGIMSQGIRALAYSKSPASLAAFDLSEGTDLWSFELKGEQGARARIGNPTWLDHTTLALVEDGQKLVSIDATTGKVRWRTSSDGSWILELLASPDGSVVVTRTQSPGGSGLKVHAAHTGKELWHDTGGGAERPGVVPRPGGVRSSLNRVVMGDGVIYSFRTSAGRAELWAQEARFGKLAWKWRLPGGSRVVAAIETPTAVLVARSGALGKRSTLAVLSRGDGKLVESHGVPGRRLLGQGALAAAGTLAMSTDRGLFLFASVDAEQVEREAVDLAAQLEKDPNNATLRTRLARRLEFVGRRRSALKLLEDGVLAEGLRIGAFDRLFTNMTALAETRADEDPMRMGIRPLPRPPEIDGELSDWWRPWSSVKMNRPQFVQPIQQEPGVPLGRWTGEEDLSALLYMGWDSKNFYFALDVSDTNLRPYDSEATNWIGDCLLIAIDCQNNGGEAVLGDDLLLSLALTLPKKKDDEDEDEQDDEERKPSGKFFVRKKDDNSGAIYEAAIPWETFAKNGAAVDPVRGPKKGFSFGLNVILTDDDGDRFDGSDPEQTGARGALKTLELTPSVLLHRDKSRLWQGYVPKRFAKISLR